MIFLPACKQTKWRPDRTKFGGEIVSQTRVPPVSTPINNYFSTPRVNGKKCLKNDRVQLVEKVIKDNLRIISKPHAYGHSGMLGEFLIKMLT